MDAEGFFRRWAKRKAEFGKAQDSKPDALPVDESGKEKADKLPTMEDVAHLAADSDYSLFVAKGTDPMVRRAAMKALFADPHFNAMDGLDVYIGDYTRPAALTPAMLAALQHAGRMFAPTEEQAPDEPDEPDEPGKDDPPASDAPDMQP